MVNGALQVCGFIVTLIGWIMTVITCALPVWRKNDLEGKLTNLQQLSRVRSGVVYCELITVLGEVIEAIIKTSGLWVRCTYQATGQWTCDNYDSFFLGLPVPLQVSTL